MTEINFRQYTNNKFGTRAINKRKLGTSLRIDMTPMVDLGFLLITFFVFTTEISKPAGMKLHMPHDHIWTPVPESKSLTVLLSDSSEVYYYFGREDAAISIGNILRTSFDETNGLGKIIREKQAELANRNAGKTQLIVLIKPGPKSSYAKVVAALDEMLINGVTRYAVLDQDKDETVAIARLK